MKNKNRVKEMSACKRLLKLDVSAEEVASEYEQVFKQIQMEAKIKGFRPGKAPMDMIKSRYADTAKEEVMKNLIEASYRKAIHEENIHPIGYPKVGNVKFDETSGLSYEAEVEVRPVVKLKNYKGLKIKKKKEAVTEDEVSKTLENLRQTQATTKTVEGKEVKEAPELNDEFPKNFGNFKNLEEFKTVIRQNLQAAKKNQVRKDMEGQILEQLVKAHSFELPESLVVTEEANLFEDSKQRMLQQGMKEEDFQKHKPEMEKRLHGHAERLVRTFFLLQELAFKENVTVTDKEIETTIEALAKQVNQDPAKVKEDWEKKGLIDRLRWQLTEAKVMDMLIKEARVTEE